MNFLNSLCPAALKKAGPIVDITQRNLLKETLKFFNKIFSFKSPLVDFVALCLLISRHNATKSTKGDLKLKILLKNFSVSFSRFRCVMSTMGPAFFRAAGHSELRKFNSSLLK